MEEKLNIIFKKLEKIILKFDNIKIKYSSNQTTYIDDYKAVAILRVSKKYNKIILSLPNGLKLLDKFKHILKGNGKVVRYMEFDDLEKIDKKLIKEIIKESMIINIENYELKKLKYK